MKKYAIMQTELLLAGIQIQSVYFKVGQMSTKNVKEISKRGQKVQNAKKKIMSTKRLKNVKKMS